MYASAVELGRVIWASPERKTTHLKKKKMRLAIVLFFFSYLYDLFWTDWVPE
jgi:hypothetical protein